MGWQTFPIPAGWTWPASTGGTWTANGTGAVLSYWAGPVPTLRWDQEAWDESVWGSAPLPANAVAEWRPVGDTVWNTLGRVLSVQAKLGSPLWYQGPRASAATVVAEQTQFQLVRPDLGAELRISAVLDSGQTKAIWWGRIANMADRNVSVGLSTLVVTGTDLIGWSFQAGTDQSVTGSPLTDGPAGDLIYAMFTRSWLADLDPSFLTGVGRSTGFDCYGYGIGYTEISVSSAVGELVRGDLGLLYTDQRGKLVFRPHNWWVGLAPIAAIGSGRSAPPSSTPYAFSSYRTVYTEALADYLNQIFWTTKDAQGAAAGSTTQEPTSGSLDLYGRRVRSDSVKLKTGADLVAAAFALQQAIGPATGPTRRLREVQFPALADEQAQLFAATVTPGTLVYVLEETSTRVEAWASAVVVEVGHAITPDNGWLCTLGLETRLPPEIT